MDKKLRNGAKGAVEVITTPLLRNLIIEHLSEITIWGEIKSDICISGECPLYGEYTPICKELTKIPKERFTHQYYLKIIGKYHDKLVFDETYRLNARIRRLLTQRGELLDFLYERIADPRRYAHWLLQREALSAEELATVHELFRITDEVQILGFWGPVFARFLAETVDQWKPLEG